MGREKPQNDVTVGVCIPKWDICVVWEVKHFLQTWKIYGELRIGFLGLLQIPGIADTLQLLIQLLITHIFFFPFRAKQGVPGHRSFFPRSADLRCLVESDGSL